MIRAVFLDAGNTLIRMNYAAIAAELARRGVAVTPEQVRHAEWRARVRLDDEVFAPAWGGRSTESGASAGRYVSLILEALGVGDEPTIAALLAGAAAIGAHAFLERAEPRVGATLRTPPARVRLWFTELLEPAYSRLQVLSEAG